MKNIVRSIKLIYKICPVLITLLGVFSILFTFISPLYSLVDKFLFDFLQKSYNEGLNTKRILYIVLLYFVYNLVMYLLIKAKDLLYMYANTQICASLQRDAVKRISSEKYDVFEDNQYYNYITTVQNEINSGKVLQIYLSFINFVSICLTISYLLYLLLQLGLGAAFLSIICCVPGFLHQATFGKKNWEFHTSKIPLQRKLGYYFSLVTNTRSFCENKIYNAIPLFKDRYSYIFNEYYDELKDFNTRNCWKGIIMSTFHSIGTVSVIVYAYYRAAKGDITLGDAVLLVGVCQSVYNNVQNAIYTIGSINEGRHSVNNLFEFMKKNKYNDKNENNRIVYDLSSNKYDMELFNIVYSYPGMTQNVLDGINLKIKTGEKIAIVGENGCGKTTLAKIILGLYQQKEGVIKLNDLEVSSLSDVGRYATVCFQNYYTYALSIRENTGLGNIDKMADDKEITKALQISGLDSNIYNGKLDSPVTKFFESDGIELSKGQNQKLSLAKAFMYKQGILVLDEPSASLDVLTENEIFESILTLMENRTTVVITHRLSNVVHCDRIVYIESGKIVEEGTHEKLISLNGKYAELFAIQAKNYLS